MTNSSKRLLAAQSLIIVAAGLAALFVAWPADAHMAAATPDEPLGWQYGIACCSRLDCRRVSSDDIEEGPDGFVIKATGEKIPYSSTKIKQSKDQYFHWCSQGGKPDTAAICLYVPNRGY